MSASFPMMGDQLKRLREERLDLTQERLGRLLDVSFNSINRWENGSSGPRGPVLAMLRALDAASRADPKLSSQLPEWEARGQNYLWAKVFDLARDHEATSSRRTAAPRGRRRSKR